MPLILSRGVPQAARRAFLWQALALARRLRPGHDYLLQRADRHAVLCPGGQERLAELVAGLGGPWQRPRYRREALQTALAGLHLYRRDEHYVLRDGQVVVLVMAAGPGCIVHQHSPQAPALARTDAMVYHDTAELLRVPAVRAAFGLDVLQDEGACATAPGSAVNVLPLQGHRLQALQPAPAQGEKKGMRCG